MFTSTSKKFSNYAKNLIMAKVKELRAQAEPKPGFTYSRYNDDEQCFQAAVMVTERDYKNEEGFIKPMTDEVVLATEIFLATDENYLTQLSKKALEEAAECDEYVEEKIRWEVGNA